MDASEQLAASPCHAAAPGLVHSSHAGYPAAWAHGVCSCVCWGCAAPRWQATQNHHCGNSSSTASCNSAALRRPHTTAQIPAATRRAVGARPWSTRSCVLCTHQRRPAPPCDAARPSKGPAHPHTGAGGLCWQGGRLPPEPAGHSTRLLSSHCPASARAWPRSKNGAGQTCRRAVHTEEV